MAIYISQEVYVSVNRIVNLGAHEHNLMIIETISPQMIHQFTEIEGKIKSEHPNLLVPEKALPYKRNKKFIID